MKYLLDTNICIYLIKRQPQEVFARFREHQVGDIGISAITYSELAYGVANSARPEQNRRALDGFVGPLEVVAYGIEMADVYGRIRAGSRRAGQRIGPLDLLIAAHALHLNLTLVTSDPREFERISDLRVENWV